VGEVGPFMDGLAGINTIQIRTDALPGTKVWRQWLRDQTMGRGVRSNAAILEARHRRFWAILGFWGCQRSGSFERMFGLGADVVQVATGLLRSAALARVY